MTGFATSPRIRFLIGFPLLLGLFLVLSRVSANTAPVHALNNLTASVAASISTAIGIGGIEERSGEIMIQNGMDLKLLNGCNGIDAFLVLLAGILAFPCGVSKKLISLPFAMVAVLLLNQVRVISLIATAKYFEPYFDHSHIYIWQTAIIVAVAALWVAWVRWIAGEMAA